MSNLPGTERLNVTGNPLDDGLQGSRVGAANPMVGPPLDDGLQGSRTGSVIGLGGGGGPGIILSFKMRAIANPGPGYEVWVVTGTPDYAGTSAPGPIQPGTAVIADQWET